MKSFLCSGSWYFYVKQDVFYKFAEFSLFFINLIHANIPFMIKQLFFAFMLLPLTSVAQQPLQLTEIKLPVAGEIKHRNASQIKSSMLGIGCEVLDRDFADYNAYKTFLGELGVKHARLQSGWAKTEKKRGVYDFEWLDKIVDDCLSRGIQPWINTVYGNRLYPDAGNESSSSKIPVSGEALDAWLSYVRALVTHFKGRVYEWELWNESDHPKYHRARATVEEYSYFVMRTAEVIRSLQPEANIFVGGMCTSGPSDYVTFVFEYLKKNNALDLINGLTFHGYPSNPDETFAENRKLVDFVRRYGDHMEARQGETGAPSAGGSYGALSDRQYDELTQAKWDLRRALGTIGNGIRFSLFSISDMKYTTRVNSKGKLALNDDLSVAYPKQSYYAYRNLTSIFDSNMQPSGQQDHRIVTKYEASLYVFTDSETGKTGFVYWLSGKVPGDGTVPDMAEIDMSGYVMVHPVIVDIRTGKVYSIPESAISDKKIRLPVYDSPILLCDRVMLEKKGLVK